MAHAVLLASCVDRPGIIAGVAQFVHDNGGNIIDFDQHSDTTDNVFFLRAEWTLDGFAIARADLPAALAPLCRRFDMTWQLRFTDEVERAAIMVSKAGHCLWDLLLRHRAGELPMEIPLVVSNHETLREVADGFAVPFHHVAISPRTKPQAEARLEALLREHDVSLVILARYMQILSPEFVAKYPQRIINIHHSFLPAFSGAKPYQKAHERGVKLTGATSHYVTADLDEGPIIEQGVERLSHRHQLEDKIRIGRDVERLVLGRAVRLHLQHRVLVWKNRTAIFPE